MKGSIVLGIFCVCSGSIAASLSRRQTDGLLNGDMQTQKALKVEEIKPLINANAKRVRFSYGPYKIKGREDKSQVGNSRSGDPYGTAYSYLADTDFPRDITILGSISMPTLDKSARITLADGLYVHHTMYVDLNHTVTPFVSCEKSSPRTIPTSVFMAGGLEKSEFKFVNPNGTFKSGYYIGRDSKVWINVDIVNYNADSRDLYMVSEIEYTPGLSAGVLQAEQSTIDLGLCDSQNGLNVQAPKGQTKWSMTGSPILVSEPGWLINLGGHLHDGGANMLMNVNGKEVCNSQAVYGGPGLEGKSADGKPWSTIARMTKCPDIEIKQGDKIVMQANYDLDKHPGRESAKGEMAEGMALFTGVFVPVRPK